MQFHLTYTDNQPNDYSIDQGADYSKVAFNYPGNISSWTPKGSIRYTWLDQDSFSQPLAIFSFLPLIYDSITDKTLISPTLAASQTLIPHTRNRQNALTPVNLGVSVYVYDIDITSPSGVVMRLVSGYVEVNPMCTPI